MAEETANPRDHDKGTHNGNSLTRRGFMKIVAAGTVATVLPACARRGLNEDARGDLSTLPRRPLGNTGMKVSILGYGSHVSEQVLQAPGRREKQIRLAIENGINLFDIYEEPGRQYERMGEVLRPVRQKVLISIFQKRTGSVRGDLEWLEGAMKELRTDYIDLLRLWSGGPEKPADPASYEAMQRAKQQGKVRAIGVAAHAPEELLYEVRSLPYDFALAIYNFHEGPELYEEFFPLARQKQVGLIAMKTFGAGSLIEFSNKMKGRLEGLDEISVPAAALRYVFENPEITCAIPAMQTVGELEENLRAGRNPRLNGQERQLLRRLSAEAGHRCRFPRFETY